GTMSLFGSLDYADYMDVDEGPAANFPVQARATPQPVVHPPAPPAPHARDLRHTDLVEPINRKKALRRNTYNIKTIAR
ncbi:hypothetical protein ACTXP8_27645, partial [Klebsiella pneumoniae]|uniref:hypothetical protein n=1 Tax=Klebsiella pneumoniae TaxID=573 RepID=UPI003FD14C37